MKTLDQFKKKTDYLISFDSDGCVMDTMNIKHKSCFCPYMIKEWDLSRWEKVIFERWCHINLYSLTRGINRFKGLAMALSEIDRNYKKIDGVEALSEWTSSSAELSEESLWHHIEESPQESVFKKALNWSIQVNRAIEALSTRQKPPFPMAKDALNLCYGHADLAIVSSANPDAVIEEWTHHGLIGKIDVIMTQNDGSKKICLKKLLDKGYPKENVLMLGDSPGDLRAAEENQVCFFPILAGREEESFREFISEGRERFFKGDYIGRYQDKMKREFIKNLGG